MVFDHIEKLKREYTDKYVVVDGSRPELARFDGHTGQVKTVNMSGRALVQFDVWNNIGWYDIELDFLKVVPKPEPKPAEEKRKEPAPKAAAPKAEAAKPAAAAAAKPAAAAAAKPAGGKPSTADILAAARAKAGSAAPSAASPAGPAAGKPSTADILAAARGKKPAAAAAPRPAPAPVPEPVAEEEAEEEEAEEAAPILEGPGAKTKGIQGPRPTVAEMIAWCRAHDTKK